MQSLGQEDPLEEGMATHSSVLAWTIPWTEEPGGPPSMWCRVGCDLVTKQQQSTKQEKQPRKIHVGIILLIN